MSLIALSVDEPQASIRLIDRLGLEFQLGSDPDRQVINAFGVQNPDTQELAIHAVYIVDPQGQIFYRKVASRRPVSAELIDAIDANRGAYPTNDRKPGRPERRVAYPTNNFQTLMEMAQAEAIPDSVDKALLQPVLSLMERGASGDDVLIAYRRFIAASANTPKEALLTTAGWLTRQRFIADKPKAIEAGLDLRRRLTRVRELEEALENAEDEQAEDKLLHQLAAARGGLSLARATINRNAGAWQLRFAQGSLRGYREVALER